MYRLCLVVLLGVWHASAQLTTPAPGSAVDCNVVGIQNCGKCDLPGMTCAFCADNFVLAADYKSCIACDPNCLDCVLDSTGKIGMCQLCAPGYEVKSDGTCGQCESFCATCTFTDAAETKTDCLACFPTSVDVLYPYLLGSYSKQCQDCTQVTTGCSSCSEAADKSLSCTGCQPRFLVVNNAGVKTCTACPNHCLSCSMLKTDTTTPTTCATCETNYVANSATPSGTFFACLYCDPTKCSKCSTSAVTGSPAIAQCSTCQNGYYLDNNKVCKACPAGCATCTSSTACSSCVSSGFRMDSTKLCKPCKYGCNTCTVSASNVETCTVCIAGFGFQSSGVSCQECPEFCTECSDPSTCTKCVGKANEFTTVIDVDGTFCMPCPANCKTCADGNNYEAVCTECNSGYQAATNINGDSYCFQCPSHCSTCTVDPNTFATSCTTCIKDPITGLDYYASATGICLSCAAQCITCSGDTCTACKDGYYVDSSTPPKCAKCSLSNCKTCTSTACSVCFDGYYYDGTLTTPACVACTKGCACDLSVKTCKTCLPTATSAPYNSVDSTPACVTCDAYCATANDCASGKCGKCLPGYIIDTPSGKCYPCDTNCDTASGSCAISATQVVTCTKCKPGYYPNAAGSACLKCTANGCQTCVSDSCSVCLTTFTSDGATAPAPVTCYINDIHCAASSSTFDSAAKKAKCSSCVTGYTAGTPGACLPNPANCDVGTLDPNDSTGTTVLCSTCSDYYGLNTDTSLCDPCPANCIDCHMDPTTKLQVCDTCKGGYTENNLACSECPEGCTACKNVNGEMFCTQCTPQRYYLDSKNGVCNSCLQCSSCTANGCNAGTCDDGYGLASDQTCTDCATLTTVSGCTNCTDADSTGMAMCLDCDNGQVLDGWGANCVDASVLTDCVIPEYRPYECTPGSCNSPFEWVTDGPGRGQCGLHCAVCGDLSRGLFLAECQNANNNYTQQLVVGACWVGRTVDSAGNVLYARGGFDKFNCTSDNQWEFVDPANSATTYKCCQSGDGCSDEIALDGVAGASAISFSLALLFASILAALRLF